MHIALFGGVEAANEEFPGLQKEARRARQIGSASRRLLNHDCFGLFEKLANWKVEGFRQLHERGNPKVFFPTLNGSRKRSGEATLVGQFFLRPTALFSKRPNSTA